MNAEGMLGRNIALVPCVSCFVLWASLRPPSSEIRPLSSLLGTWYLVLSASVFALCPPSSVLRPLFSFATTARSPRAGQAGDHALPLSSFALRPPSFVLRSLCFWLTLNSDTHIRYRKSEIRNHKSEIAKAQETRLRARRPGPAG